MTAHQTQAHELIMKFYLSEKGISKAMAKRLALISIKESILILRSLAILESNWEIIKNTELVKTEIENYKFKK